ncbi:hypothetical protein [Weissella cibaria]
MKKLVLASLLSVSVLGAISAAFASNTADTTTATSNQISKTSAKTDASVSVTAGDLTLSNVTGRMHSHQFQLLICCQQRLLVRRL